MECGTCHQEVTHNYEAIRHMLEKRAGICPECLRIVNLVDLLEDTGVIQRGS